MALVIQQPTLTLLYSAAKILASDYNYAECGTYLDHWKTLLGALKNDQEIDPIHKMATLKCITLASKSLMRTLANDDSFQNDLVFTLATTVYAEKNLGMRCLAVAALADCLVFTHSSTFPSKIRRYAFRTLLRFSLETLPPAKIIDPTHIQDEFVLHEVLKHRVVAVYGLSKALASPEAANPQFMLYIRVLLSTLLVQHSLRVLQIATLRAINFYLPRIPSNQSYVESVIRPIVQQIIEKGIDDAPINTLLQEEISHFWSVWSTRLDDRLIKAIHDSNPVSPIIADGYARRRLQNILAEEKPLAQDDIIPFTLEHKSQLEGFRCEIFSDQKFISSPEIQKFEREARPTTHEISNRETASSPTRMGLSEIESLESVNITFNLSPLNIVFNRYPLVKDLYLQNKSSIQDNYFTIQVHPIEFFSVVPSFGTIPKGESMQIRVSFTPQPQKPRKYAEISGFMRIRSKEGIPLERISLKGYNSPSIKMTPKYLDFGQCPLGETRVTQVWVQNLLLIECPCVLLIGSNKSSSFIVATSQTTLLPREKRGIKLKFSPSMEGFVSARLYVIAMGGDVFEMQLGAWGGEPVRFLETKVDFGQTDIHYGAITRRIFLENRSSSLEIPIIFESSTTELIANKNTPLILKPQEVKPVEIAFKSTMDGSRQETLRVSAPNMNSRSIEIMSFTGQSVIIPLLGEIIFPTALTSLPSTIQIPITNFSQSQIHCSILVPALAPFTIHLMDIEHSNRKTLERTSLLIESKPYDGPDGSGVVLTLGPKLTAALEINFLSTTWGTFRAPLTISLLKPKKAIVSTYYLNAIAVNEVYFIREKPLGHITSFLKDPSKEAPTGLVIKRSAEGKSASNSVIQKPSTVFELEPSVLTCYGTGLSRPSYDVFEYVTLSNNSLQNQPYTIILSHPYETDMPLTGELPGMSTLEIPIRLRREAFERDGLEAMDYYSIGQITILDSCQNQGMVSSAIYGIFGDLLSIGVRKSTELIKFPSIRVMEKQTRRIFIRNKAAFEVVWEGRIVPILDNEQNAIGGHEGASFSEWCPFGLNTTRISLKPFELGWLEIQLQATSTGEYKARLQMNYVDPMPHVVNQEYERARIRRELPTFQFTASVGTPEIEINDEFVSFGEVQIGNQENRPLQLNNLQPLKSQLTVFCPKPFDLASNWIALDPHGTRDFNIGFNALKHGGFSGNISILCGAQTLTVPILGCSGVWDLDSNVASPLRISGETLNIDSILYSNHCVDFGIVNTLDPGVKMLQLQNKGTFDMVIRGIILGDNHLRWKLLEDYEQESLINNTTALTTRASKCIDWDEVDFKAKDEKKTADSVVISTAVESKVGTSNQQKKRRATKVAINMGLPAPPVATNKYFPMLLRPNQYISLVLLFGSADKGLRSSSIKVDVEKQFGEIESFQIWTRGTFQPPLQVWEKKIEFGIKAVHSQYKGEVKFTNSGTIPLPWSISLQSVNHLPIARFEPEPLPKNRAAIRDPIRIFPKSGTLDPGCTQSVDVVFIPSLPQYEVFGVLSLKSEKYAETNISVHGIGASSLLVVEPSVINFGVLLVGTSKVVKVLLRNKGILQSRYFLECNSAQFNAEPEQGLLEGDASTELTLVFSPKGVGDFSTWLKIYPAGADGLGARPIIINIQGTGSYPELVVHTKVVDFGIALFGAPNRKSVMIENKGSAPAKILFSCCHQNIVLENGSKGELVLPPHSFNDLWLVYTPQIVEFLDIKVFIRSTDTRGDYFMVQLKGTVGVPKLVFEPEDILNNLDYGVCAVNSVQKKHFVIKNGGNISLTFNFEIEPLELRIEEHGVSKVIPSQKTIAYVEPHAGVIAVGDSRLIEIGFTPNLLASYIYELTLRYDFRTIRSQITGIGGRAILSIDSPLRYIDFGTCRSHRAYRKFITVSNYGNLGVDFHVRPEGTSPDWGDNQSINISANNITSMEYIAEPAVLPTLKEKPIHWVESLRHLGLRVVNPDGFCNPNSKTEIIVEYKPLTDTPVNCHLKIYFAGDSEDIEIRSRASIPKLAIYSSKNEKLSEGGVTSVLDLGVHPINSEYIYTLQLANEGPFGIDYMIEPIGVRELNIFPLRGFIEPGVTFPLRVLFRPSSENKFQLNLKILWEQKPLKIRLVGAGGVGKLEVSYIDDKDIAFNGLDFGMVPFNTASEKRFFVYNVGLVPIVLDAEVDIEDFTITQIGDPFNNIRNGNRSPNKRTVWNWHNSIKCTLPSGMGIELAARFISSSPTTSIGSIAVKSDCRNFVIPMRGKGGTFTIAHKGDLSFGDIASNFTYNRKITLTNSGSIPSSLSLEWLIVGHNSEPASAHIKLSETYTTVDPRSGWARIAIQREKNFGENYKFMAKDNWRMIAKVVKKPDHSELTEGQSQNSTKFVYGLKKESGGHSAGSDTTTHHEGLLSTAHSDTRGRLGASQTSHALGKRGGQAFATHFKRRQMLFHLITNTQLTSQSNPSARPFLRVDPPTCILPSYGEITLSVDLNLSTEDTFLATLLIKSNIPNTPVHEIPLTATPKAVGIYCDDTRILNFYRQPLGEPETITRNFSNVGHRDISFRISNSNPGLVVVPSKGVLKFGQTLQFQFIFRPIDEAMQTGDVIFEPDCSQPIRLKMSGGGGFSKASLAKYRRFDFGHCMIGKDTVSLLPITNEGNAMLHLTRFEINQTTTFFKGVDWPSSRVSLFPGQTYNLALVFNPHEENPPPGKLVIGTNTESWEIELIGLGREAVLIVSKVALEFTECLIGNSYERKLGLKNVGDVNYPVTFKLEKDFPDLEFIPNSLVINPFSESYVVVLYTPTKETRTTVVMTVLSPYSTHKVPVLVHSGTSMLEFSTDVLDFGMFERVTRPSTTLTIKNTGTVRTSFAVKDVTKPSMFHITGSKGLLLPGKMAEVKITHIRHEVCQFTERLIVRSDLIDKFYYIAVKGQCEEALLKPDEFSLLNMGICPVLESTSVPLSFTNYGRFPLEYSIKSAYPLKVAPAGGRVDGGDTTSINVTWNPSGGYELRTQLTMVTNIGNYNIIVRGKAAFPELGVKNMYLDFGVCAVGQTYIEKFPITNKGKVPLHFNIPPLREPCYSVSTSQGMLDIKESLEIDVFFKPNGLGRFASSFIIECKGISYKEIVVAGIGGNMRLDISPQNVDIGKSPWDLRVFHVLLLTNNGDVTLNIDWDLVDQNKKLCTLTLPEPLSLQPNRVVRCIFGATAHVVGPFSTSFKLKTKEKDFIIGVHGVGVKIVLTERSRHILQNEHLPVLGAIGPFEQETRPDLEDIMLKRYGKHFLQDLSIVNSLEKMFETAKYLPRPSVSQVGNETPIVSTPSNAPLSADKEPWMIPLPFSPTEEGSQSPRETPVVPIPNIAELSQKLLESIKKLEQSSLVTREDASVVLEKFLELKRDENHLKEPEKYLDSDPIVHAMLDYGHVKISNVDMSLLTDAIEPNMHVNIELILARPPAFSPESPQNKDKPTQETVAPSTTTIKGNHKYQVFPSLNRQSRNARTVDFFRSRVYQG